MSPRLSSSPAQLGDLDLATTLIAKLILDEAGEKGAARMTGAEVIRVRPPALNFGTGRPIRRSGLLSVSGSSTTEAGMSPLAAAFCKGKHILLLPSTAAASAVELVAKGEGGR
mmetsp:Transcript_27998/g.80284  ORF Transcript_27998/g.80284 Transcript_27998/m.80284 type:complete len:113 (+) Transcript_27998:2808-3146(+)